MPVLNNMFIFYTMLNRACKRWNFSFSLLLLAPLFLLANVNFFITFIYKRFSYKWTSIKLALFLLRIYFKYYYCILLYIIFYRYNSNLFLIDSWNMDSLYFTFSLFSHLKKCIEKVPWKVYSQQLLVGTSNISLTVNVNYYMSTDK